MIRLGVFLLISLWGIPSVMADTSNSLFKKISPLIFRVKSALTPDAPKASYGSGFVVDKNGTMITNYHVISDVVQRTSGYRNFVMIGDKPFEAKILALDIVHDLALIKIEHTFPSALSLVEHDPTQGESIFSFGIPLDFNMSIVSGLFNGFRKIGPFDHLQMSTPINAGMSGGPTTDARGNLVGVNVSTMTNANNLTFAVPWRYVKDLIQEGKKNPFTSDEPKAFHSRIEEQLIVAQNIFVDEVLKRVQKSEIGSWTVPEVPDMFKCWMVKKQGELKQEARKVDETERICNVEQGVFLTMGSTTLNFVIRLLDLKNLKLNRFQFGAFAEEVLNSPRWVIEERPQVEEEDQIVGMFKCDELQMWNAEKIPLAMSMCTRHYTHYPRLFETYFKFAVLDSSGKRNLIGTVRMDGFTKENTKRFMKEFIDHVSLKD